MSIYFLPQKPVFLLNELNKIKFCSFYLKYYIFSEFFQIVLIILSSQTIYQKQDAISYEMKKRCSQRLSKPNRLSCLCLHLHHFIKKKPLCEILRLRAPPPYSILLGLGK